MEQTQILQRQEKGQQIAKTTRITRTEKGWKVPSQTGTGDYLVVSNGFDASCTCPDHETRHCKCKHIWAVEYIVTKTVQQDGTIIETHTIKKTYSQDWKNYNIAQQKEKELLMKLLADLTGRISQPIYTFGRPGLPLSDMAYSMIFKVYSTFSGRRFTTDMSIAKEKGYLTTTPHYNSIFNYFQKEELTPLLMDMVTLTSLPLRTVEKDFAIDSTGFGTSNFQRWFSFKHGKEINSRRWVKCHFMTGVKTNTITSVKITSEFDNDCPELPALTSKTGENFSMEEVSADKAYLSQQNIEHIRNKGATPYIPFKSNSQPSGNGMLWKKMYHYFMLNNDEYMTHYHKRSNVESSVHMMKSKFGDNVRSKTWTAQVNEVLCKVICHNICVIIQSMYELGVNPDLTKQ